MSMDIVYASFDKEEHNEIKISDQAIQNYGIKTIKVAKDKFVTLPQSAFVASRDQHFVYAVDKDGGYVQIEPHRLQVEKNGFTFSNEQNMEEFVIEGAKYLRMINLSQDAPATGHSH